MNTHFNLFFPEEFNQERENQRLINLIVDWFETQRLYNSAFGSRNAAAPMNNTLDPADLVYQTAPDASAGHQSLVDVSPFMNVSLSTDNLINIHRTEYLLQAPNPADSIYQSEHHASVGHQSLVDVSPFMNVSLSMDNPINIHGTERLLQTPDPNTNTSAPYMESAATVNFNSNLEAASELPVVMPPLSTADKNALSVCRIHIVDILVTYLVQTEGRPTSMANIDYGRSLSDKTPTALYYGREAEPPYW